MFGQKLREVMSARGLTVAALSRMTGISQPSFNHWLAGRGQPNWNSVVVLSAALGVSTEVFVYPVTLPEPVPVRGRGRPRKVVES
jgi:transcriptional regulator with XRE-family HTH domain